VVRSERLETSDQESFRHAGLGHIERRVPVLRFSTKRRAALEGVL
jgi:hypothetical protein